VIRLFEALGLNFEIGFVNWLFTLTIFQVISILVFAVIDVGRNIGKIIALTAYNIKDRRRLNRKVVTNHPKITLLVPAHNESVSIKRTIISILENNYPNKEIIIIDDHSSDDTFEQARELLKEKKAKGQKLQQLILGLSMPLATYS
jgi:cellulose synthase/poly-beta-1,6-N-acetylglucosamine synthase-like glycosyltransferase